jgi:large subunit ribosomal protein L15e
MEAKMGMYKYIRELWKQPRENLGELWQKRILEWKKESATIRIEKPTRIDRAKSLGYKAKQGFVMVRQRVERGGRQREAIRKGRKPKKFSRRKDVNKSYQWVAEERAAKKYPNCEVLNSYYVGEDGTHFWYEIILLDRNHPQVMADPQLNWVCTGNNKGRACRGLTSAGRKSRGLRHKGKGAERLRPSKTANVNVRKYK